MAFIQVELDAMERAGCAARASGVPEQLVVGGLSLLWRFCWREKVDVVSAVHLAGMFGAEVAPGLTAALLAFGFLVVTDAGYRVKGAERYLRIRQAQSAAGKANAANLRRGKAPGGLPAPAQAVPGGAGALPGTAGEEPEGSREIAGGGAGGHPGEQRAANSEQRTAKEEEGAPRAREATESTAKPPAADPVTAAGALRLQPEALRQLADRRAPDSPLRAKPPTPLPADGLTLRDRLGAAWLAKKGTTYGWVLRNRGREGDDDHSRAALALANGDEAEVLARWVRALNRQAYPVCGGLRDLATHWNYYATDEPTGKVRDITRGTVRAEDYDAESHRAGGDF